MLNHILIGIVGAYVLFCMTWIFYLAFMNLKDNRDKLTPGLKKIMTPWLVVGLALDVVFNVIYGTIVFRELPRELLFTSRCQRHLKKSSGRKLRVATWHCIRLLDPFEEGGHC